MLLFDRERRGILSDLRQLGLGSISKILKFEDITSVEVGGEPYAFVFPRNMQELEKVMEYIMKQEIPFWIVGNGTKLLVKDGKLSRLVISLNRFDFQSEKNGRSDFTLTLGAGVSLQFVVAYGIKKGLEGVEKIRREWDLPVPKDAKSVIAYYTNLILKELKIGDAFADFYPIVKKYVQYKLFNTKADIDDPRVLYQLSRPEVQKKLVKLFVDTFKDLTFTEREPERIDTIKLSDT